MISKTTLGLLAGTLMSGRLDAANVQVVTTLPNFASITRAVGGDELDVFALVRENQDPHFLEAKPTYMGRLRDADLFLVNGLDLEIGWVPSITRGARNPRVVESGAGFIDLSRTASVLEIPTGNVSRAEGDVHPRGNPHYMLDPLNALAVAREIAAALQAVAPQQKDAIAKRSKTFETALRERLFGQELVGLVGGKKLEELALDGGLDSFLATTKAQDKSLSSMLGGWLGAMQPLKGTKVITYHKDFTYFARRFDLDVVGFVEPKPGISPSAKHLVELVEQIKRERIPMLITRPWAESRPVELLAEKAGIKILIQPLEATVQQGGEVSADAYFDFIDATVRQIVGSVGVQPDNASRPTDK